MIERIRELSNSEINRLIEKCYKREKCRKILRDRLINGMLWKDIVKKYYPEYEFASERRLLAKWRKVAKIEYSFYKRCKKEWDNNELRQNKDRCKVSGAE